MFPCIPHGCPWGFFITYIVYDVLDYVNKKIKNSVDNITDICIIGDMDKQLRYEEFTEEESKMIEETVALLQKKRSYSTRPFFYHDMILLGCQTTLTRKRD